jgi:electron transfer flavoprotein alpha/beta subunit
MELKRQLKCMDTFVPMIVDTRIKLDIPRGMAARGKDQASREELIAIAKREFVVDKAPERHRTICDGRQAIVEAMPPDRLKALLAMGADGCLAEADCHGFTRCQAPVLEKMLVAVPPQGERHGE